MGALRIVTRFARRHPQAALADALGLGALIVFVGVLLA